MQGPSGSRDDVAVSLSAGTLERETALLSLEDWSRERPDWTPRARALHAFYRYQGTCDEQDRETLRQATVEDPTFGPAQIRSGFCILSDSNHQQGEERVETVRLGVRQVRNGLEHVRDPMLRHYLGFVVRRNIRDDALAAELIREAIEIRPDFDEARLELARIHLDRGRVAEAVTQLDVVLESRPDWRESLMEQLAETHPDRFQEIMERLEVSRP